MERFQITFLCPTCRAIARLIKPDASASDRSITWTDGYREIADTPPPPQITRCSECHVFYWVDSAIPFETDVQRHAPPLIEALDENGYYEAIDSAVGCDREHELALRVLAWWCGNNRFRKHGKVPRFPTDHRAVHNLERLVDLCAGGDHEVLLTNVEGLRQLGRFDEASQSLSGLCSDYQAAGTRLAALIAARSRDLDILFD